MRPQNRRRAGVASKVISEKRMQCIEQLESRVLLASVTVSTTVDEVNGNTTSIAALIGTPRRHGYQPARGDHRCQQHRRRRHHHAAGRNLHAHARWQ